MKSDSRIILFAALAATFLAGCGEQPKTSAVEKTDPGDALTRVFTSSEPSGAITVSEARKSAKPGEAITVAGKIAGADHPFTEGFAAAILADTDLQTCDLMKDPDHCPTPWDACCADPDVVKASRLTFQVNDQDGRTIPQGLKGLNGIKELSPIVIRGTVAESSTPENLIVNVERLYVAK